MAGGRDKLTPAQKQTVVAHIAGCEWCEEQYLPQLTTELVGRPVLRITGTSA
jgi:hypothetical protein